MIKSATFSGCGLYRYTLFRGWSMLDRTCVFIGLNPSTADADNDDPTIRRCIGFAKDFGCGSLLMLNLFAYRSTRWKSLTLVDDPTGQENHDLGAFIKSGSLIVAAWGAHAMDIDGGARARVTMNQLYGLTCLKLTKDGHPAHPLYLPKTLRPVEFGRVKQ